MSNVWENEGNRMPGGNPMEDDPEDDGFAEGEQEQDEYETSQNRDFEQDDRQQQEERLSDAAEKHHDKKKRHHKSPYYYRSEEQESSEERALSTNVRPSESATREYEIDQIHSKNVSEAMNRAQRRQANDAFTFSTGVNISTTPVTLAQLDRTKSENAAGVLFANISQASMKGIFDAVNSGMHEHMDAFVKQGLDTKETFRVFNAQTCQVTKVIVKSTTSNLEKPVCVRWDGKSGLNSANNVFMAFPTGENMKVMTTVMPGNHVTNDVVVDRSAIQRSELHRVFGNRTFTDIATNDFQPIKDENFAGFVKVRKPTKMIPGESKTGPAPLYESVINACGKAGKQVRNAGTWIIVPRDVALQVLTNAKKRVLSRMDQLNLQAEDGLKFTAGPYTDGKALTDLSGTKYDPSRSRNQSDAADYRENELLFVSLRMTIQYTLRRNTDTSQLNTKAKSSRVDPVQDFANAIANIDMGIDV